MYACNTGTNDEMACLFASEVGGWEASAKAIFM